MVGFFYLVFSVMLRFLFPSLTDPGEISSAGNYVVGVYFTILVLIMILSLTVDPAQI